MVDTSNAQTLNARISGSSLESQRMQSISRVKELAMKRSESLSPSIPSLMFLQLKQHLMVKITLMTTKLTDSSIHLSSKWYLDSLAQKELLKLDWMVLVLSMQEKTLRLSFHTIQEVSSHVLHHNASSRLHTLTRIPLRVAHSLNHRLLLRIMVRV